MKQQFETLGEQRLQHERHVHARRAGRGGDEVEAIDPVPTVRFE